MTKSVTLMGLPWYPSKPAPIVFCRSSVITDVVMAMTGIPSVVPSARSLRSASTPSVSGSRMSIKDQARAPLWGKADALFARLGLDDLVALECQHVSDQLSILVVVLDDQD